jgi:hypothetical protein
VAVERTVGSEQQRIPVAGGAHLPGCRNSPQSSASSRTSARRSLGHASSAPPPPRKRMLAVQPSARPSSLWPDSRWPPSSTCSRGTSCFQDRSHFGLRHPDASLGGVPRGMTFGDWCQESRGRVAR